MSARSAQVGQPPQKMGPRAPPAESTKSFSAESALASQDSPTTKPTCASSAPPYPTDSSKTDSVQFALET